jgi:hypothetical protein
MTISWEITIIKETKEGFLCASPNGDTRWLSKEDYEIYLENRRKVVENTSL